MCNSDVGIFRIGHRNPKLGVITVATSVDGLNSEVHYGVSYCSPLDRYQKQKGTLIARGRIKIARAGVIELREMRHKSIAGDVVKDILAKKAHPDWARPLLVQFAPAE